jgi:hypothetical protein
VPQVVDLGYDAPQLRVKRQQSVNVNIYALCFSNPGNQGWFTPY